MLLYISLFLLLPFCATATTCCEKEVDLINQNDHITSRLTVFFFMNHRRSVPDNSIGLYNRTFYFNHPADKNFSACRLPLIHQKLPKGAHLFFLCKEATTLPPSAMPTATTTTVSFFGFFFVFFVIVFAACWIYRRNKGLYRKLNEDNEDQCSSTRNSSGNQNEVLGTNGDSSAASSRALVKNPNFSVSYSVGNVEEFPDGGRIWLNPFDREEEIPEDHTDRSPLIVACTEDEAIPSTSSDSRSTEKGRPSWYEITGKRTHDEEESRLLADSKNASQDAFIKDGLL